LCGHAKPAVINTSKQIFYVISYYVHVIMVYLQHLCFCFRCFCWLCWRFRDTI